MRRIDENTYIDDTLVTCAEYQLFIDEMREQGKYYQPDHWTSYQYQKGKAKDPILGTRYSDAREFCKWLTKRESTNFLYRLPEHTEVTSHKLLASVYSQLGFWVKGQNNFAWGSVPLNNPRVLTQSQILDAAYSLDLGIQGSNIARRLESELNYGLGRSGALDFTRNLAFIRKYIRDNEFNHISKNIKRYLNRKRNFSSPILFLEDFSDISVNAFALAIGLLDSNSDKTTFSADFDKYEFDFIIDICIDIITLQHRRLGRSPAFEGIRLVKERIR